MASLPKDDIRPTSHSDTTPTASIPAYEPLFPGYRWDDYYTVGEMYDLGKKNPCNGWAMKDIWGGSREKVHCSLPLNHEEDYNMPHIDVNQSKAWQDGWITDLWFKDKAVGVGSSAVTGERLGSKKASTPSPSRQGEPKLKGDKR